MHSISSSEELLVLARNLSSLFVNKDAFERDVGIAKVLSDDARDILEVDTVCKEDPAYVDHVQTPEGSRWHVPRYCLENGQAVIRCSVPNCILNKGKYNGTHDVGTV